jgi:hypothetical protein
MVKVINSNINHSSLLKTKITAILLLIVLMAPVLSTYGWLQYKKYSIKKEVKRNIMAGLNEDNLTLLKFAKAESRSCLYWEHAGEFEYQNRMYDVVKKYVIKDSIYYLCWPDDDETQLNIKLKRLLASAFGDNPQKKEKQTRLYNFFKSINIVITENCKPHNPDFREQKYVDFRRIYVSTSLAPPTPPPQIIS